MSESRSHLVDHLLERGIIDRWGFLLFAFGGAAAILIAKAMGVSAIPVAAGAAILMVAYAAIVQTSGTGRLRADQAGDNCYYLGLIYTLTSLAYAIFFFDPADTATTIVQGFGIALATTIMGLVLRVFFNQSRVDLVQTEDTARIELAEAAGRLKTELSHVIVSMNDFSRSTRQSLEELRNDIIRTVTETHETAAQTLTAAAAQATQSIAETASQATQVVTEQTAEAISRTKRLSTATDKVVGSIERHAAVLAEVESGTAGIGASLAALESAASSTTRSMDTLAARAEEIRTAQTAMDQMTQEMREGVRTLLAQVQAFDAAAIRFDEVISARIAEVSSVPEDIAARAGRDFEEALRTVKISLEAVTAKHEEAAAELARHAADGTAAIGRHNEALEAELARSRENVTKVHAALVEMTGRLADQVEAKAA